MVVEAENGSVFLNRKFIGYAYRTGALRVLSGPFQNAEIVPLKSQVLMYTFKSNKVSVDYKIPKSLKSGKTRHGQSYSLYQVFQ